MDIILIERFLRERIRILETRKGYELEDILESLKDQEAIIADGRILKTLDGDTYIVMAEVEILEPEEIDVSILDIFPIKR